MENKYLEKIAGWASNIGRWTGLNKALPKGGGGAVGSVFNAADSMVGTGIRNVQKALKPTQQFNTAAAGRSELRSQLRSVNNASMSDDQIRGALRQSIKGQKIQFGGKTLNNKYLGQMSGADLRRAHTRANIQGLRQNAGLVREKGTGGVSTLNGQITGVNRGNYTGTPKSGFDSAKLLPNTARKLGIANASNQRISTTRAKVGLAAAGVAGVGGLGYHMANKKNEADLNAQYGNMPY